MEESSNRQSFPRHAWGQERRLAFIEFRLLWERRINRKDLIEFFGISAPQASADLKRYAEKQEEGVIYDASAKAYVPEAGFKPLLLSGGAEAYLNELLALWSDFTNRRSSFLGWIPPVGAVPLPKRTVVPDHLATILYNIRMGRKVEIKYQSTSRPEPSWRAISPHAFAWDGQRWHVRAYCHSREEYRDFLLTRIVETGDTEATEYSGTEDYLWHQWVQVRLGPNSQMSEGAQKAIELDYDMVDGEIEVDIRAALVFYLFQRLGLPGSDWSAPPGTLQLELLNPEELKKVMGSHYPSINLSGY